MDLQGMQSMVFTPAKGQIWLGTPPVVLHCIFVFFHGLQLPLREKQSFSF